MNGTQYWRTRFSTDELDLVGVIRAVRNVNPSGKPKVEVDIEITDPQSGPVGEVRTVELRTRNLGQAFADARCRIGATIVLAVSGLRWTHARDSIRLNSYVARHPNEEVIDDKMLGGSTREPTEFTVRLIDGDTYDEELSITRWRRLTEEATNV